MMYICHDCGQSVNRGEARMRSIRFEQVAYCADCWAEFHAETAVPGPRLAIDEARERLQA